MIDTKQVDGSMISILLIDDHKLFLDLLEKVLSACPGMMITGKAATGEEALSCCEKLHPQIVLLDINIGTPDGFEITKQIRKISPGTKVIGLSMFAQVAYVKKLFRSGGTGYVTKNSDTEELVEAIRKVRSGDTFLCKQILDTITFRKQEELHKNNLPATLTLREIEIIQLISSGNTSKEIAEKLFLTPKTVELHRYNVLHKLNIKNTAALIAFAYQHCLWA